MRLTLRTLLAYRDDMLSGTDTKSIGDQISKSEVAQELIEKLKVVTRKRRLGTGQESQTTTMSDPNKIAEYLDNVLDDKALESLESKALEDDEVLAEIAANHQILTLVLGEPAKVPPTASRRMYRLVQGPESIPYRKPTTTAIVGVSEPDPSEDVAEDDPIQDFALSRRLIGMTVILCLLVFSIWMAIPNRPATPSFGYVAVNTPRGNDVAIKPVIKKPVEPVIKIDPKKAVDPTKKEDGKTDVVGKDKNNGTKEDPKKEDKTPVELGPSPRTVEVNVPPLPMTKVDPDRRIVGVYDSPKEILYQKQRGEEKWERVKDSGRLSSADMLLSLPGVHAEVKLESGVRLTLWGNLPELLSVPILESRVTLHVPSPEVDAEFTLHSGRVFITAPETKKPLKVRVRFLEELWEITLSDASTEVAVDLIHLYPEGSLFAKEPGGESPTSSYYLGLLKGRASVQVGFKQFNDVAAPKKWEWDNKGMGVQGPVELNKTALDWWSKVVLFGQPPQAVREAQEGVRDITRGLMKDQAPLDVEFGSILSSDAEKPNRRTLAIWFLQATNNLPYIADGLASDFYPARLTAIRAAQHWCAQEPDREIEFYNLLIKKKGYNEEQATQLMQLLHLFSKERRGNPETFETLFAYLNHEKIAIRELAFWHLIQLDPTGAKEKHNYDAGESADKRQVAAERWATSWRKRKK